MIRAPEARGSWATPLRGVDRVPWTNRGTKPNSKQIQKQKVDPPFLKRGPTTFWFMP